MRRERDSVNRRLFGPSARGHVGFDQTQQDGVQRQNRNGHRSRRITQQFLNELQQRGQASERTRRSDGSVHGERGQLQTGNGGEGSVHHADNLGEVVPKRGNALGKGLLPQIVALVALGEYTNDRANGRQRGNNHARSTANIGGGVVHEQILRVSRDPRGNERRFNIGKDWLYRGLQRSNQGRERLQGREEHGELGVS